MASLRPAAERVGVFVRPRPSASAAARRTPSGSPSGLMFAEKSSGSRPNRAQVALDVAAVH
jgi:hypothetical protein